jgi:hypothetical protein
MEKLTPKESKYLEKLLIPPSKKKVEENYDYIKWAVLAILFTMACNFLGLEDLGERFLR